MKRKLILVIDPDETTFKMVEGRLNGHFQVLSAPHGERAIEIVRQGNVDIVILARCLTHTDGLDVLKDLQREVPSLPVIFIAAYPDEDLIISALRAGANDFFKKPLDTDKIMDSVKRLLNTQRNGAMNISNNGSLTVPTQTFFQKFLDLFKRNGQATTDISEKDDETEPEQSGSKTIQIRVNFFGNFHIIMNEKVIEQWPSKKGKMVFAYLAYNHKRRIFRDTLMDTFWPNSAPDSARNCLNVALHGIRQLLHGVESGTELILFKDDCYTINPDVDISIDVEEFMQHWRLAQSQEREKGIESALGTYELAAALYKGDFMEEDLYEEWTALDRENYKEIYLVILDNLSKHYGMDGRPFTAVNLCKTILEKDECREDIHCRLMRCYYKLGQRDKAIRQFHKCEETLREELEIEPTRTTTELFEKIRQDSLKKIDETEILSDN